MSQVNNYTSTSSWTAIDLVDRFGAIPLHRVVQDPAPGTATVADVVRMDDHEDRLCELIDGTLVEKTMGVYESYLAAQLIIMLGQFVKTNNLGIVVGADGMVQLEPEQVRIPDGAYISQERLDKSRFMEDSAPLLVPDLAVEVISKGNTRKEMQRKLSEYFEAGVRLVWYVYPRQKEVKVYTSPTDVTTFSETDTLSGGEVLPGLSIDLKAFFTLPAPQPPK
ncbi:MAG: Uma2 family endonuclease [Pirellulales bacterium]|nr:Uma2 family endonuclease [Pirellulales bacterium]